MKKLIFLIPIITISIFANNGYIDMHGGKPQKATSFYKKIDSNNTNFKNFD